MCGRRGRRWAGRAMREGLGRELSCHRLLGREMTWSGLYLGLLTLASMQGVDQREEQKLEIGSHLGGEC